MSKSFSFLFTIIFCSLLLAAGCTPSAEKQLQPKAFFPLTSGISWVYRGEGNEYAAFTREIAFSKDNLAQITENNSGTVITAIYRVTDECVARVFSETESYNPGNLLEAGFIPNDNTVILKSPLEAGISWGEPEEKREIIAVNTKVETPLGVFDDCIKIKTSYPQSTVYEYFSRGIGLVKREFVSGDYQVTSTLEKFTGK